MLTTLAILKARVGLETFDTTDDAVLANLLSFVSARFAAECNRIFDYGVGVTYEFRAEEMRILVDRPPIESVSQFELKTTESAGWILQPTLDYLLSPRRSVIEFNVPLGAIGQLGRVTYTGGFVLPGGNPTGNQLPLPAAIELACMEQVAYWYQRRAQLGLVSVSSGDTTVQQFQSTDLLPQVRAVLKHYERWVN